MRLKFLYGRAGKFDGKDETLNPRFGYNWWLWIPFIRLRIKKYGIYFDTSWLCYWWGFSFLPYYKESNDGCQVSSISNAKLP